MVKSKNIKGGEVVTKIGNEVKEKVSYKENIFIACSMPYMPIQ